MQKTAQLKVLPVGVLRPAAYNPRKKLKPGDKEYEKIKNSITEFGFADPLVVNSDMTIVGGHQRLAVAMNLGYTEVPCAVVDVDKVREKALNIALNKITGAWDDSLLADLLKDIEDSDFDLGKTGFEPPEIDELFNKVHDKEVKEDDFDVDSELKRPAFSKKGDIWHLGKHTVICGDSTQPETYTRLMGEVKANLVCTDPPYMVALQSTSGTITNDDLNDHDAVEFLMKAFSCFHEAMANDALWRSTADAGHPGTVGTEHDGGGAGKKRVGRSTREMTTPLFLLRCVELGIAISDLDLLTIGLVIDMWTEKGNDDVKYKKVAREATQEDFDAF